MFDVHLICNLWEIQERGIEDVLDCVQGELGADGVTVIVASEPVVHLRRACGDGPLIFRSRGGVFYHPDPSRFTSTRYKPVVTEWLKKRNLLADLNKACQHRSLSLSVVVNTARLGRVVAKYRDAACQSAFGDVSPARLCLNNPDVVALCRGLIVDLSTDYELSSIELRDATSVLDTDLFDSVSPSHTVSDLEQALMGICFCPSCLQSADRAGVDGENAARRVRHLLSASRDTSQPATTSITDVLSIEEPIAAMVEHNQNARRTLLQELAATAQCDILVHTPAHDALPYAFDLISGSDVAGISIAWNHERTPDDPTLASFVERSREDHLRRCNIIVPAVERPAKERPSLVAVVKSIADSGASGVTLDRWEVMTEHDLTVAKQAIRYAKRSSAL